MCNLEIKVENQLEFKVKMKYKDSSFYDATVFVNALYFTTNYDESSGWAEYINMRYKLHKFYLRQKILDLDRVYNKSMTHYSNDYSNLKKSSTWVDTSKV